MILSYDSFANVNWIINFELFSFTFSYFLYLIMFVFIGFLLNLFLFNLVLLGFIGESMKKIFLENLNRYILNWFNKILFSFLIIYFIFVLSSDIIYLDTTLNLNINELDLNVSGEYIDKIFTHYGAATAFVVGSKLAAAFLTKHPISLGGKIGVTIGTGAGSTAAFQMVNYGTGLIKGKILAQKGLTDGTINLYIKDVVVNNENNLNDSVVSSKNLDPSILIPKFQSNQLDSLIRFNEMFKNKLELVKVDNSNSKIIQMIEKQNSCSLNDIFSSENSLNKVIINSPLESNDLTILSVKNDIITMLNYNLTVNLIMIYLIFMLTLIFIFKLFYDKNISLDKVNNLPLGNYFKSLIIKLLSAWKRSSNFWILFILFFLFLFSCSSAYGIYACLFILK